VGEGVSWSSKKELPVTTRLLRLAPDTKQATSTNKKIEKRESPKAARGPTEALESFGGGGSPPTPSFGTVASAVGMASAARAGRSCVQTRAGKEVAGA